MKRIVLGLVAAAALLIVPVAAEAGHGHRGYPGGWGGGNDGRWDAGYRGGWGGGYGGGWGGPGPGCYHRPPRVVYRPPVVVRRPFYPPVYNFSGPDTSFFYNGPNASLGFGF